MLKPAMPACVSVNRHFRRPAISPLLSSSRSSRTRAKAVSAIGWKSISPISAPPLRHRVPAGGSARLRRHGQDALARRGAMLHPRGQFLADIAALVKETPCSSSSPRIQGEDFLEAEIAAFRHAQRQPLLRDRRAGPAGWPASRPWRRCCAGPAPAGADRRRSRRDPHRASPVVGMARQIHIDAQLIARLDLHLGAQPVHLQFFEQRSRAVRAPHPAAARRRLRSPGNRTGSCPGARAGRRRGPCRAPALRRYHW